MISSNNQPYLGSQWRGLQYAVRAPQCTQGSQGTPRELPGRLQQTGPPETLIPSFYRSAYCTVINSTETMGYTQSMVDTVTFIEYM